MGLDIEVWTGEMEVETYTHPDGTEERSEWEKADPEWGIRTSYGGFNLFRRRLAAEIGIHLDAMDGFAQSSVVKDEPYLPIAWEKVNDPIVPFLNHSDCDGELSATECAAVSPRIRELVMRWPEGDRDRMWGLRLADQLDEVARRGTKALFR